MGDKPSREPLARILSGPRVIDGLWQVPARIRGTGGGGLEGLWQVPARIQGAGGGGQLPSGRSKPPLVGTSFFQRDVVRLVN